MDFKRLVPKYIYNCHHNKCQVILERKTLIKTKYDFFKSPFIPLDPNFSLVVSWCLKNILSMTWEEIFCQLFGQKCVCVMCIEMELWLFCLCVHCLVYSWSNNYWCHLILSSPIALLFLLYCVSRGVLCNV